VLPVTYPYKRGKGGKVFFYFILFLFTTAILAFTSIVIRCVLARFKEMRFITILNWLVERNGMTKMHTVMVNFVLRLPSTIHGV
jgi:hypothetical protein